MVERRTGAAAHGPLAKHAAVLPAGRRAQGWGGAARRQPAPADELVRDWRGRREERERGVNMRR